jgi:signal transduction histidine kinase
MTTADETRRRLERDLHDGVQQRLVHTAITLKLARQTMGNGDGPAVELVDESLEATAY